MAGIMEWFRSITKNQTKEEKKTNKPQDSTQVEAEVSDEQRLTVTEDDHKTISDKTKNKSLLKTSSKVVDKPTPTSYTWNLNVNNLQGEAKIGNTEFLDQRTTKSDGSGDFNIVNKGNKVKVIGDADFIFTEYPQHVNTELATASSGKVPKILNDNNEIEIRPSSKGEGGSGKNKVVMTQVVQK